MSTELYLIHLGFIVAIVFFTFRSGQRSGRSEMVAQLIEDKLVQAETLIEHYKK